MAQQIFKGFKQVTLEQFNSYTDEEKIGYLWLVRSNIEDDNYDGDIYFGTRHYAHQGNEVQELEENITTILTDAGILDESGETINVLELIESAKLIAGDAIDITGKTISVKVAEETENTISASTANKNFLEINEDNQLKVKGVDADASVIATDIVIEGGEWAEAVKKVYTSGVLPAGTTLQDFFQAMLCVEKWGNPSNPSYSFTAQVNQPSISADKTGDVPVGTIVTFGATAGTMKNVANSAKVTGYTYGYSLDGETVVKPTGGTYNASVSNPSQDGNLSIACSVNAYLQAVDDVDGSQGAAKQYYVLKGTGVYTVSETGKTVTRGSVTDQNVYNASNLGNVRSTDVKSITDAGFQSATSASITPKSNNSKSISGFYPVFFGATANVNTTQADITEQILTNFGYTNKSVPTTCAMPSGTGTYICAVPSDNAAYNKSKIVLKDAKDMSFGASNAFTMTVNMLNNVETVNYKVFFITNAGATTSASNWTITFE